eukprot:TRINITY_DN12955_c0_g1_i1.p1 TRINITY_DN12955_c0_g1~~TRINITY_DN12955_c0_g1_i1.p1  ORF type:complete len:745 (-),score=148.63 TRINITY_DN12955_c0_g1_i1:71-2305(-)
MVVYVFHDAPAAVARTCLRSCVGLVAICLILATAEVDLHVLDTLDDADPAVLGDGIQGRSLAEVYMCAPRLLEMMEDKDTWKFAATTERGIGNCNCLVDAETKATALHSFASRAEATEQVGFVAKFVDKLVRGGGKLLERDVANATALHIAVSRGSLVGVVGLCKAGAGWNLLPDMLSAVDSQGRSPQALAEAMGHATVAKTLFDFGPIRRAPPLRKGECPWASVDAIHLGDAELLEQTLASLPSGRSGHGTDGNNAANCLIAGSSLGPKLSLLHFAVAAENFPPKVGARIVQVLLEFGANPLRRDASGETALMVAARTDGQDVADVLMGFAAMFLPDEDLPGMQDKLGRTAVHIAAANGASSTMQLLLRNGATMYTKDSSGMLPQELAERGGHNELADLLGLNLLDPLRQYPGSNASEGVFNDDRIFFEYLNLDSQRDDGLDSAEDSSVLDIAVGVLGSLLGLASAVALCGCLRYFKAFSSWNSNKTMVAPLPTAPLMCSPERPTAPPPPVKRPAKPLHLADAVPPGAIFGDDSPHKLPDSPTEAQPTKVASVVSARVRTPPQASLTSSDLPAWCVDGGAARWWSTSAGCFHDVRIRKVDTAEKTVEVVFEMDSDSWKRVAFDHFLLPLPQQRLHPRKGARTSPTVSIEASPEKAVAIKDSAGKSDLRKAANSRGLGDSPAASASAVAQASQKRSSSAASKTPPRKAPSKKGETPNTKDTKGGRRPSQSPGPPSGSRRPPRRG